VSIYVLNYFRSKEQPKYLIGELIAVGPKNDSFHLYFKIIYSYMQIQYSNLLLKIKLLYNNTRMYIEKFHDAHISPRGTVEFLFCFVLFAELTYDTTYCRAELSIPTSSFRNPVDTVGTPVFVRTRHKPRWLHCSLSLARLDRAQSGQKLGSACRSVLATVKLCALLMCTGWREKWSSTGTIQHKKLLFFLPSENHYDNFLMYY
jgi:hypothetical protein